MRSCCRVQTSHHSTLGFGEDYNDLDVSTSWVENWSRPLMSAGVNNSTPAMHTNSSFIVKPRSASIWSLGWCGSLVSNSLLLTSSMSLTRPPKLLRRNCSLQEDCMILESSWWCAFCSWTTPGRAFRLLGASTNISKLSMIPVSLGNSFLMAGGMIAKMKSLSGHLMRN